MPTTLEDIPLGRLLPHGSNPRVELGDLDDLAESIKAQGILQPLIVAPLNGTQYTIIAGHRRHAAAKKAGLLNVPCEIREDLDTPAKQLVAILVENTQRRDLTVVEEGDAYTQLVAYPGWSQAKAAKAVGRDAKTVQARIKIAKLPEKARAKIASGQATLADAARLADYAGKPEYSRLEAALGTSNFEFALADIARERTRGALATAVRKYAKDHGWTITGNRLEVGPAVLSSWDAQAKTPDSLVKFLDELDGEHVLFEDSNGYWSVRVPADDTLDDDPDDNPDTAAMEEQRRQAAEHRERLTTAREVRTGFLRGRLDKPVLKPAERLEVLRLIVERIIGWDIVPGDDYAASVDLASTAGLPTTVDDENKPRIADRDALDAWVAAANEHQLIKALLLLNFTSLLDPGALHSDQDHRTELRLATALGYEPSDFEAALLEEATA